MKKTMLTLMVLAGATIAFAGTPTIDGLNIPTEFPAAVATQDTNTRFGNNQNELNQMFVDGDTDNLYIGLTGNIADNNAVVVFFDTAVGVNSNVLATEPGGDCPGPAGPTLLRTMNNSVLETDFTPEYALVISVGTFPGQATGGDLLVMACDLYDIPNGANESLGLGILDDGSGALSGDQGVQIAIDNSNLAGVGNWDDGPTPADTGDVPSSATSGFEIGIPRSLLVGLNSGTNIRLFAWLTNNAQDGSAEPPCNRQGFSSNQSLPGMQGADNLGSFNPGLIIDFTGVAGTQYVDIPSAP